VRRRHVMLWTKTRTAQMFCVSAGKGEGGDVVRALASVLFGHASERSRCWRGKGRWSGSRLGKRYMGELHVEGENTVHLTVHG